MVDETVQIDGYSFRFICGSPMWQNGIMFDKETPISPNFAEAAIKAQRVYDYHNAFFNLLSSQANDWIRDIKQLGGTNYDRVDKFVFDIREGFDNGYLLAHEAHFNLWYLEYCNAKMNIVIHKPSIKLKRTKAPDGFVYLIRLDNGICKIGLSKNPETRIKSISTGIPFSVETLCIIPTSDMFTLESDLHSQFANKRTQGEWFNLSQDDIDYIKGLAQ